MTVSEASTSIRPSVAPQASATIDLTVPPFPSLAASSPDPMLDLERSADLIGARLDAVAKEIDELRAERDQLLQRNAAVNQYMRRLDEEMRLAAKLQQDFLPRTLPSLGPVRFEALWRPAGYVSGDFYDVRRLDEHRVGFYIADAVGHGVPAALLTMFIKHSLVTKELTPGEAEGYRVLDPGESLARLNNALVAQGLAEGTFVTACYATIDVRTLELRIASAGHPSPMVLKRDGTLRALRCDGPLLGIFDSEQYASTAVQLERGDRLVAYTDGVEVAFPGAAGIDAPQWNAALSRRRHLGAAELIQALQCEIDGECGSLNPRDDLTLLVLDVAE